MITGIDVSHWQDIDIPPLVPTHIDFFKARQAGAVFVFIKASQGFAKDHVFDTSWTLAYNAGLLRGAYHFYSKAYPPEAQAKFFCDVIRTLPGELPPVLDYEPAGASKDDMVDIMAFMVEVERSAGKRPIFYSNPNNVKNILEVKVGEPLTKYPLWIAQYPTQRDGETPEQAALRFGHPYITPWEQYHFWQYSSHGDGKKYGAESGNIDLNYWNGTMDELNLFCGIKPKPPVVIPDSEKLARLWKAHPELW